MAIKLKLLIDKEKNRVVLAESDKYFVDTLFSFLTIPIGSIVRLSSQKSNIGCMDALHESIQNLDSQYLQTEAVKEMLCHPRNACEDQTKYLALNVDTELTRYYRCTSLCKKGSKVFISTVKNVRCHCGQVMSVEVFLKKSTPAADAINEGVFVKETMRFIIGDDLQVSPISTETSLSLLNKHGIKDWTALEEKSVDVGANEVLHILRRLFVSTTPLTDVFLRKPEALEDAFDSLKLSPKDRDIVIDKKDTRKDTSLKLLINKSNNKVVYAEATNDFLDLLISFLTFPLASVVKLLGPGSSIGCLDNLYKSVEDLSGGDDCIISEECRAMLLDPKLSLHSGCDSQLLPVVEAGPKTIDSCKFGRCFFCGHVNGHYDPNCSGATLHFVNPKVSGGATECGGGFVKGPNMKFMVTDGLDVKPLSFISGIPILDRFNVPISDVQKRVVSVGVEEALSLLKASLSSKTVLSEVFCQKNANQSKIKLERK